MSADTDPNRNQGRNCDRRPDDDLATAKILAWGLLVAATTIVSILSALAVVFPHLPG